MIFAECTHFHGEIHEQALMGGAERLQFSCLCNHVGVWTFVARGLWDRAAFHPVLPLCATDKRNFGVIKAASS